VQSTPAPSETDRITLHARVSALSWLAGLGLLLAAATVYSASVPMPTEEETRKIQHAVPDRATVAPQAPRRVLIFGRCRGYYHVSIPYGTLAVRLMGERTGAFSPVVSDDTSLFEEASLKNFDALCFVSALGEVFLPEDLDRLSPADQQQARERDARLKRNVLNFVASGRGWVGIHGACYAFHDTPAFAELVGAAFDRHPWNSDERIAIRIEDPTHPVVAAFGGCGFDIIDEGYQFKDPYSRDRVRVLYSLNTARTDMNKPDLRPDRDFPLGWVRRHGSGRVFYSALGHNNEEYWNPNLLRHFLDGLQFALGDLPAETKALPAPTHP
jgi:type 1 glutamine amidotransferase